MSVVPYKPCEKIQYRYNIVLYEKNMRISTSVKCPKERIAARYLHKLVFAPQIQVS